MIESNRCCFNLINNRPRKYLDYQTPNEVFYKGRSDSDAIQT
ncbi:hypothetical protein O53_2266 [Microcystis aeruginosa TAIHU98]|uniref:Uncharacterized protein n=1 Tax=Microcystis aeruginosa TAIHU98 TaxID=1134457 RepID=L7E3L3_MICAE|nr:hypothetical protein O53_2266 [Microcystis aeruginosa TAIHU98]ODV35656.1 Mobile element protein [Microcystis aeruginosa NIES-98]